MIIHGIIFVAPGLDIGMSTCYYCMFCIFTILCYKALKTLSAYVQLVVQVSRDYSIINILSILSHLVLDELYMDSPELHGQPASLKTQIMFGLACWK